LLVVAFFFCLEDGNVLIDFGLLILCDTLGYPNDVPYFLLFQLDPRIEHSVMELLLKCQSIELYFILEKRIFEGLVIAQLLKYCSIGLF